MRKTLIMLIMSCCWALTANGGDAVSATADPVLEARVNKLSEELRCLVCQNQNLADSHAELAIDLKNQVREMLQKGMSEQQVMDYLVQRYGDFVLYRPPVKATTWLLWGGPFLLLIVALLLFFKKLRRRPQTQPLTAEEHSAASSLLNGEGKSS